jgi:acetyl esterase
VNDVLTGPSPPTGWRGIAVRVALAGLRASLTVSPRPMVWAIRRQFAKNGAQLSETLRAHAPAGVTALIDECYGHHRDERLDAYWPDTAGPTTRLPTVVWTHGGGFLGGNKDELAGYFQMIAATGLTVVGVDYSLAPRATYPSPVRQVMAALRYLRANADRLHVDPTRLVLATPPAPTSRPRSPPSPRMRVTARNSASRPRSLPTSCAARHSAAACSTCRSCIPTRR